MLEAEMMARAQAQSLIQGLSTPIPTMFLEGEGVEGAEAEESEDSVMELSQNL